MKNISLYFRIAMVLLAMVAMTAFVGACGDDDDDDDDAAPVDDDTAIDDDVADDDVVDDDVVDDDTIDDDDVTPDDDTIDDDDVTPDDDTIDDDTSDDDTGDDDIVIEGCIEGDFSPYWGNLHSHTTYSDGQGIPEDAFTMARDQAGLDIMMVTDHLEQLYLPFPSDRYGKCKEQADDFYVPGEYLADCGFEYGSGFLLPFFQSTGHNNVFFSDDLFPMVQLDFHDFYDTLVNTPGTVGQFNHPLDDPQQHWNHYEYFADVDEQLNLMEMSGTDYPWETFTEALAAGWHVSPMYNQDNHDADWGIKNDRRSGFFLSDLTREDLYDAMMARRSFMSYDKNALVSMMANDTCWMGSILEGLTTVTLSVEAYDDDPADGFTSIEIYGPDSVLLDTVNCESETLCQADLDYDITEPTYFVAKAIQDDGDWLVGAPIWFK